MTLDPQVLLLKTLDRYEQQIEDCPRLDDLIPLFCTQIVPFLRTNALLEPLANEWREKYLALAEEAESYEKKALHEVKSVFRQLVEALKKPKKLVREKIAYIKEILSGNLKNTFSLWPLSRVLYFEVKELLQLLLESGEVDLCKQYASLRTVPRHIIQKESRAIKIVEEFQIETYTFALSIEKAVQALKVIH